jgi:Uma2 family endonuclease
MYTGAMTTISRMEARAGNGAGARPALESGDHLSRDEFERRYTLRPDIKKAELIGGIVYVASPVRIPQHAEPHGSMMAWAFIYAASREGVRAADNGTVRLSDDDEPQPDVFMWREPGQAHLDSEGYLVGAPELAAEIAASSASIDLHEKKERYRRAGVQEYIVWLTEEERILWFRLRDGAYVELEADAEGVVHSEVFEGLRLDVRRLLAGDRTAVLPSG